MQIPTTPAAVLAWLDTLTDSHGQPLTRDQAAALLGVSRSTLFYQASDSDNPRSAADKVRPGLQAVIDALATLRTANPAEFAALVERRIAGIERGKAGRPARSRRENVTSPT